jgi:hypothetical protein
MLTIIVVLFVGWILFLATAKLGRLSRSAFIPVVGVIMLGISSWALMGEPGLSGAPVKSSLNDRFGEPIEDPRLGMVERFGPAAQWLGLADGLLRGGRTESAAKALEQGLRRYPRSIDLWVGYGNALVAHGGGMITPAASMAFERAAELDPRHPAPAFFSGLALAQSGDREGARAVWQQLLDRSPPDAPYRSDLELRLAALSRGQNAGPIPRPAQSAQ